MESVPTRSRSRRRWTWIALLAGVPALAIALALFQPWKLWVNQSVHEALPSAAPNDPMSSARAVPSAAAMPTLLASGALVSHEHATTGTARVLRLPDGSQVLRLENLDTSNGPDLHLLLSDAKVTEGRSGWHVFDDGRHLDLGSLKGNKGSQNYPLPAGTNLADYGSVSVWCDRFNVSFGAATLRPVRA